MWLFIRWFVFSENDHAQSVRFNVRYSTVQPKISKFEVVCSEVLINSANNSLIFERLTGCMPIMKFFSAILNAIKHFFQDHELTQGTFII